MKRYEGCSAGSNVLSLSNWFTWCEALFFFVFNFDLFIKFISVVKNRNPKVCNELMTKSNVKENFELQFWVLRDLSCIFQVQGLFLKKQIKTASENIVKSSKSVKCVLTRVKLGVNLGDLFENFRKSSNQFLVIPNHLWDVQERLKHHKTWFRLHLAP